jgi:hypothetical protein
MPCSAARNKTGTVSNKKGAFARMRLFIFVEDKTHPAARNPASATKQEKAFCIRILRIARIKNPMASIRAIRQIRIPLERLYLMVNACLSFA